MEEILLQKVEYWKQVRPPSLKQFLHRKIVRELMKESGVGRGVGVIVETGRLAPLSAIRAKALLKGLRAEEIARLHPEWVEEYHQRYKGARVS